MPKKVTKKAETTPKKSSKAKRPARRAKSTPAVDAGARPSPSVDAIRARAYEIYASGRNPGDPVADWFQAVQELSSPSV